MSGSELLSLYTAAMKAGLAASASAEESPEVERCIEALKQLRSFPINKYLLTSTQVERRLGSMQKNRHERIRRAVSEIMESWKALLVKVKVVEFIEELPRNLTPPRHLGKRLPKVDGDVAANEETNKRARLINPELRRRTALISSAKALARCR